MLWLPMPTEAAYVPKVPTKHIYSFVGACLKTNQSLATCACLSDHARIAYDAETYKLIEMSLVADDVDAYGVAGKITASMAFCQKQLGNR